MGRRTNAWVLGMLIGTALPMAVPASPAVAQEAEAQRFSIPAQALSSALLAFADETGFELLFDARIAEGRTSPGVEGSFTAAEALERLLAGTGLQYRFTGSGTVTLERPVTQDETGPLRLGSITVVGEGESAFGPVDGYVATRASTALKTDTPLIETPQSVTVVTRDQLTVRNVETDTEALVYAPGVWAEPFGTRAALNPFSTIRGFSSALGGDYVDGLSAMTNSAYEPYGMERVELMRGPTSVLYGQNDPGGIINRVSKRPTDYVFREVQAKIGTFDRYQAAFDLGGPVVSSGVVTARLTGLVREGNVPFDYAFDARIPDDRVFLAPSLTWAPSPDTSVTFLGSVLVDDTSSGFTFHDAAGNPTKILVGDTYEQRQYGFGYTAEHRIDDAWMLRQNLRFDHMEILDVEYFQAGLQADGHTLNRGSFAFGEQDNQITVDTSAQFDTRTGPLDHKLLAGLDFEHGGRHAFFAGGGAPTLDLLNPVYGPLIEPQAETNKTNTRDRQIGLYVQDQISFGGWILTLGGRHDWARNEIEDLLAGTETVETDSAFTGRAGLTYVSEIGLAPYVSYSESFLPTGGTDFAGNAFEPTTGEQYEAGIKYQPADANVFAAVSVYQLTKQNALTPDPNNINFSVQTGEIRSRGLEVEVKASLDMGLDLTASYSYTDAVITADNPDATGASNEGNQVSRAPEHIASAWADYTIPDGAFAGLGFGGGVRWVGPSFVDDANTLKNDATTLVDAALHYDWNSFRFALNANNLLDREYATCWFVGFCVFNSQRNVTGTLTYRW